MAEHLISAPGDATYTSGQIQNELIDIIGRQIRQYIASQVQQAKWITVIADEVTDASNKEQLSLVVRFAMSSALFVSTLLILLNVTKASQGSNYL